MSIHITSPDFKGGMSMSVTANAGRLGGCGAETRPIGGATARALAQALGGRSGPRLPSVGTLCGSKVHVRHSHGRLSQSTAEEGTFSASERGQTTPKSLTRRLGTGPYAWAKNNSRGSRLPAVAGYHGGGLAGMVGPLPPSKNQQTSLWHLLTWHESNVNWLVIVQQTHDCHPPVT
jgi:hypothetical protein